MLRLSERNANIFADCNASDSNIDFVKGVPSGQAFTSEGVLVLHAKLSCWSEAKHLSIKGDFKT